jgi:hypothetical protein
MSLDPEMIGTSSSATDVLLVASGDLREGANRLCWPVQAEMENRLTAAFARAGRRLTRAHPFDVQRGHGFLSSQRMGMNVFRDIDPESPLVVAESVWQYSHHVLPGLLSHKGPILTIANWSGTWPGLVGLLNLNGCLRKAGVPFSTTWSENFTDEYFCAGLKQWVETGSIHHDASHVRDLAIDELPESDRILGSSLAKELLRNKVILGVFDEGCMGMYNAIIEDYLMNRAGFFKERLSQSSLVAEMREVSDAEAMGVRHWLDARGFRFLTGGDGATDLTNEQIADQCRMYIAAGRIADQFGCDAIGIQYQQGLKDMTPASDLAEGLFNNTDRPPIYAKGAPGDSSRELYPGASIPHFNEVDECAGVDAVVTTQIWRALGMDPSTTLHDVRWGEWYKGDDIDDFVWTFQISGAVPASHIDGGYAKAVSERQPPMYFGLGGGTLKGICKPGELVWSRVFVEGGELHIDLGRARAIRLPDAETERRWRATTYQWPIQHVILKGIGRDQFMARQAANHVNVVYAPNPDLADRGLQTKAAMLLALGIKVHLCGV